MNGTNKAQFPTTSGKCFHFPSHWPWLKEVVMGRGSGCGKPTVTNINCMDNIGTKTEEDDHVANVHCNPLLLK